MGKNLEKRFWEIDFLRGCSIIGMLIYHLFYDLNNFTNYNFRIYSGPLKYFQLTVAGTFLFLVGLSLTLSHSRLKIKKTKRKKIFLKYLKRGMKIFSFGLIISIVTYFFLGKGFVKFGVLHLIGLSLVLAFPFLEYLYFNMILGLSFIILGTFLRNFTPDFNWLFWLGVHSGNFSSADYFPIFPWFGVVLIGIFFGNLFYRNYERKFKIPDISDNCIIKFFSFLGRNSLVIYLVHQPILISLIYLFT